jgi:hypothetical protein
MIQSILDNKLNREELEAIRQRDDYDAFESLQVALAIMTSDEGLLKRRLEGGYNLTEQEILCITEQKPQLLENEVVKDALDRIGAARKAMVQHLESGTISLLEAVHRIEGNKSLETFPLIQKLLGHRVYARGVILEGEEEMKRGRAPDRLENLLQPIQKNYVSQADIDKIKQSGILFSDSSVSCAIESLETVRKNLLNRSLQTLLDKSWQSYAKNSIQLSTWLEVQEFINSKTK